jgi:hypothetical protein
LASITIHQPKEHPVTDAKEVGVGNAAEETFCHRTIAVIVDAWKSSNPLIAICSPSIADKIVTLPSEMLPPRICVS